MASQQSFAELEARVIAAEKLAQKVRVVGIDTCTYLI
jgi:hypothetical protein